jgi:hypothetical protein
MPIKTISETVTLKKEQKKTKQTNPLKEMMCL